ncbi:MAG: transmembrane 220 family protein [Cyclobacteriaceae bacterium]
MKVINFCLFLLFALFTYVNLNDPDPFLWVLIYGAVALISLLRIFGIFYKSTVFILMIALGVYALLFVPSFWEWLTTDNKSELFGEMVYEKPYIEGTREFGGLVIADMALALQLYWKKLG